HHWRAHLTTRHIKCLGSRVDDLVNGLHRKVEGHELDDWLQARHRSTNADTGKAVLGDWSIDNALCTKFLQQTLSDLVGALVFGNFFTHDEDFFVRAHFFRHRVTKSFANGGGHKFC